MTRDKRIIENLGLVRSCVSKFIGKGVDYEDLYSAGCIGLIKAVDGFDESLGFAFSTYAVPSILGEIRRIFRDGGAVKISRTMKEKARLLNIEKEKMEKDEGTEPTVSSLAKRLNISVEETAQLLCVTQPVLSLTCDDEKGGQIDIPDDDNFEIIDERIAVRQVIDNLPYNDKNLISLRFYKGYTQTQTAKILGISQVQVSRREKAILGSMRQKLG